MLSSPSWDLQYKNSQIVYGKRKYEPDNLTPNEVLPSTEYSQPIKKVKINDLGITAKCSMGHVDMPLGLQWKENSCAYDATLTILYNAWQEDSAVMANYFTVTSLDATFKLNNSF